MANHILRQLARWKRDTQLQDYKTVRQVFSNINTYIHDHNPALTLSSSLSPPLKGSLARCYQPCAIQHTLDVVKNTISNTDRGLTAVFSPGRSMLFEPRRMPQEIGVQKRSRVVLSKLTSCLQNLHLSASTQWMLRRETDENVTCYINTGFRDFLYALCLQNAVDHSSPQFPI